MKNKKKLIIITSILAVGIPLFAISTQTILKKARDDYYKVQKQQIEAEKAKERAEKEQRLAQEKAEREKQIQEDKKLQNKSCKGIRINRTDRIKEKKLKLLMRHQFQFLSQKLQLQRQFQKNVN